MAEYIDTPLWGKAVNRFLKSEMAIKGMKYRDLQRGLADIGTYQTDGNLRQKINRGQLSAQLFLQLLIVLKVDSIEIAQFKNIIKHLQNENKG